MKQAKRQFLKDSARYIRGEINEIKLNGSKRTIKLFVEALRESRALYVALQKKTDMSHIIPILESKKQATSRLRERTGFVWPF
jgi:hypothetical protein